MDRRFDTAASIEGASLPIFIGGEYRRARWPIPARALPLFRRHGGRDPGRRHPDRQAADAELHLGKHNGFEAIREYTRLKSVIIDHSGTTQDSLVMRLGDAADGSDN